MPLEQVCQGLHFAARQCVTSDKFETTLGGLAQLARALAWHARGHRFDSDILHLVPFQRDIRSLTCWNRREKLSRFLTHSRKRAIPRYAPRIIRVAGQAKAGKGARRMPVAREGDEGRGKLRKAPGREEKTKRDSPSSGERPGNSPNRRDSGSGGVVGPGYGKRKASGSVWKVAPQTVKGRYAKPTEAYWHPE